MMLVELTTMAPEAVPVAAFKDHLRLGSGFSDDGLQDQVLESYLRAAMAAIEARTGKILMTRSFGWTLTEWRNANRQPLPLAPVTEVLVVTLIDAQGDDTPVPASVWRLEPDLQRPSLASQGASLPRIPQGGSVRIEMEAGYSETWEGLPADLRQAVLMLAAHFYEYRHEAAIDGGTMPFGVTALIERYRTVRTFLGKAT